MRVYLILAAAALAGCAPQTQYIRADGRYASPQSIEGALAECSSDAKENLCMVGKGYINVPADQAEAERAQLAAITQANEQAAQAKADEQAKLAKAKGKERQAKPAAAASERALKPTIDDKNRKQTESSPTSGGSVWSSTPTFMSTAPAR